MEDLEKIVASLRLKIKNRKNEEVLDILKATGVNIMIRDIGSPLNLACLFENWEIALYCILNGADVNSKDVDNGTPLINACRYGNLQVVEKLLEARADVNAKDKHELSALARAIMNNKELNYDLIEFLLKNGAKLPFDENYYKELQDNKLNEILTRFR